MRRALLISAVVLVTGCAAFQNTASPADAAAAETQITQAGSMVAPFLGPFAPFAPIAAALAVQVGRLIRAKK